MQLKLWPLLVLIFILGLVLYLTYADAADAHWSGNYSNPVTKQHCCDLADCHPIKDDSLYEYQEKGVYLKPYNVVFPYEQTLASEDGDLWICYWGNAVKCVFIPVAG